MFREHMNSWHDRCACASAQPALTHFQEEEVLEGR